MEALLPSAFRWADSSYPTIIMCMQRDVLILRRQNVDSGEVTAFRICPKASVVPCPSPPPVLVAVRGSSVTILTAGMPVLAPNRRLWCSGSCRIEDDVTGEFMVVQRRPRAN